VDYAAADTSTPPRAGAAFAPLELWGGLECTVNRVGDEYLDQLAAAGHDRRPADLDRIAALGVRALRYPVLWERTAPEGVARADWSWPDARLGRLRALGVRPIVGLVHHGSGPRHTSLVDPGFAEGLAAFARAVAERYPWVDAYTPVNEPLTTARFAGLYGHWYPHGRDEPTFARALLTQCRAVALAMRAVREVNPAARLVQTDDLGTTSSTPRLAHQAAFDNERRWLTWDLLCGRVVPGHRLWQHLTWLGVPEGELAWFAAHPSPPDVVGVNTYVTSERFLDHRTGRYPPATRGGNGREAYADVEAVRVLAGGIAGPAALLAEAWARYRRPVAVTEAHLGGTREEQLRWLLEVWHGAQEARATGAEVVAVTAWSLLGAYDWDSLVTRRRGHYEPGAFDLRGSRPRPTALARLLPELAAGAEPRHPVLDGPGWWRRDVRLLYPPVGRAAVAGGAPPATAATLRASGAARSGSAPILIAGASGALARAFVRACRLRGLAFRRLGRATLAPGDGTGRGAVGAALARLRPWAVIHLPGRVGPGAARPAPAAAAAAAALASGCAERGLPLLTLSTDLVFGGRARPPYAEGDAVAPEDAPGRSAAGVEAGVLAALPSALVVRTGPRFGPWDARDPLVAAVRRLAAGRPYAADDETLLSPTYVPDLVDACLDLLVDNERGLWHLANPGPTTWFDLVGRTARLAGVDPDCLERRTKSPDPVSGGPALGAALRSERGTLLPPLDDALRRFLHDARAAGTLPWPAPLAAPADRRPRGSRSSEAAA
jgi:dTDP-4-dehydrorhamnose reductase